MAYQRSRIIDPTFTGQIGYKSELSRGDIAAINYLYPTCDRFYVNQIGYMIADANKDGRMDVFGITTDGYIHLWENQNDTLTCDGIWSTASGIDASRFKVTDHTTYNTFGGTGFANLIAFSDNGNFSVWLPNGNVSVWGGNCGDIGANRYKLGRFNNNTNTDVISFEANGGFYVWLSTAMAIKTWFLLSPWYLCMALHWRIVWLTAQVG